MKARNCRYATLLPVFAVISLSAPSLFAATGTWNGNVGGGDGFWDATANTEWTGVTGNAWDATNGPNNIAQFNAGAVGANPGTSGTPVANGIIWNNTSGGVSSGSVKLDGTNPFINVTTSGTTSQMFANLTGTNGFTKTGAGQFFLIDTVKGITGGITVNQGLLRLDLSAVATASGVANSSNALNLSGSTLEVTGRNYVGTSAQTLSNFTLNTGGSTIRINPNSGTGTTLSLANWTRTSGTNSSLLVDSSLTGTKTLTLTGTLPTLSNGIIGSYATIRDSTTTFGFATLDVSNNVVRYTAATVVSSALGANTVSGTNYRATSAGSFFNGSGTAQSLNSLDIAVDGSVGGNTSATFTLGSGGLLYSLNSTFANPSTNLKLTSSTSELQVSSLSYNNGFASSTIGSSGGIYDNGSAVSLVKAGPGGFKMSSGTFSYTGDTIVNQGVLDNIANIPSGSGKGNLVVNAQGIVALGLGASGTRTINGLSNTTLGGGTVNNQNYTSTAATAFLNLGNNNATASFSGVMSGNFSIIKSGTGTQTLSGVNTYAGSTAVNAGILSIASTGRINGTSAITIGAGNLNYNSATALSQGVSFNSTGGTLSGTGTITPAVTITTGNLQTAGSSVTAANTTAALGKQILTTSITYSSGSIFEWNLNSSAVGTRGIDYDAINTASLGGSGATFRVILNGSENFSASFWNTDRTWAGIFKNLAESTSFDMSAIFSTFEYQNSAGTVAGVTGTQGAFTFVNSGQDLKWTAVPEPTSALAGLLITAGLLRRRRTA
jgi:fibronectin-binding autotransporter adhesin